MKKIIMFMTLIGSIAALAQNNDLGTESISSFTGLSQRDASGSDSFDGTEMTMSPRFGRWAVVGEPCTSFGSGDYGYRTYEFTSDASGTMTVDFDPGVCDTSIYVTFHEGSFDPANMCANYFWAYGSSDAFTETFACPPNSTIVMVVNGVNNAPSVACGPYSWSIAGVIGGANAVPTLGEWSLISFMALFMVVAVFLSLRQRRA